ncbi:unnamed protein product [Adineta ricciae]|uniref:PLAT domain-containing protein n=1 Tax=Adineta ricciae TaxID=249248 RepID=A0A814TYD4_ADIRI|nr:unnamed protein product [Adineta ricciae]
MITTKADRLLRSLIDAGLSLTDFILLATKVIHLQQDFQTGNEGRRERDRVRQENQRRMQYQFEEQLKEEEQRRLKGLAKLRELGYVINDEINTDKAKDEKTNTEPLVKNSFTKDINEMKEKQRDCCLTFNIDYDLRLNQQTLERACKRAKRNIYELRADRFNRPEHRSILSVETNTLHNKLKESIREINRMFLDDKLQNDRRHLQELLTYINQFQGDIDLLMCQMQDEPKVKETILFSPVTTDILDRMNLSLYYVRTLAKKISTGEYLHDNFQPDNDNNIINNLQSIPNKVAYIVKIKTNDDISSSLSNDTNVFVRLHGAHTKSSDIRLLQSIHKHKWQSGQIDVFNIELNYLGEIYAMEIWHDGEYSSWKVDWIEVLDDSGNLSRFPLDRLFDKHSDEKKTRFILQRDIGPVSRLPTKSMKQSKPYKQIGFSTYTVQVKTGKQPNKATDSLIFMEIHGENGQFADNLCSAYSAFKSSIFEPDHLDTFYLIWPHLGKLQSLHLSIQSEGQQPIWFCEYIIVEDGQTGVQYKFIVNQSFDGLNFDNLHSKKQLTVYPEEKSEKNKKEDKPSYFLKLKTGDKGLANMSKIPAIMISLKGEHGKSDAFTLNSSDNKRKLFRENHTDEFVLPSTFYVGSLQSLKLSTNEHINEWFVETIIIRDMKQKQDYFFPVYKWMKSDSEATSLIVHSVNEQKPDYIVYIRTITSELTGPDRNIKLHVEGTKGKGNFHLTDLVSMYNNFQPGRKDEYYIAKENSLGELQSIEIDITHPNIKKLGIDYIEIKDMATNELYKFVVNRVLDSKNSRVTAKSERISQFLKKSSSSKINHSQLSLPSSVNKKNFGSTTNNSSISQSIYLDQLTINIPQGAKRPTSDNDYKVLIKTGRSSLTGIDPKVYLQLHGEKGVSKKILLKKSNEHLFKKNQYDTFALTIPNVGHLKSATLSVDGKLHNEWSITKLEIVQESPEQTYQIDLNTHLNDTKTEVTFDFNQRSSIRVSPKENVYRIKMKTIKRHFEDQSTKIQLELIDDHGRSETIVLGETDTFTIETMKDLGKLKNLKLSLIGSKSSMKDFYQAEFLEVFHPKTNRAYRVEYTKDDFLNSQKNRFELINSVRSISDINSREAAHPQGTSPSSIRQSSPPSYKTFTKTYHSDTEEDDLSLQNNTTVSSLSERITNGSTRQIRPGDRVKNIKKRQSVDQEKQVKTDGLSNRSTISKTQQTLNALRKEMMEDTQQQRTSIKHKTDDQNGTVSTVKNPILSNIPERRDSIKSNKTSSDMNASMSKQNGQQTITASKSVPPNSRISKDDFSKQNSNSSKEKSSTSESFTTQPNSKPEANITKIGSPLHRLVNDSVKVTIDNIPSDSNFQTNAHAISAVTIHTIATKSDSDSNVTQQSHTSRDSEHSLQSKSLLSPDSAKKSRKNRRRKDRHTSSSGSLSNAKIVEKSASHNKPDIQNVALDQKYLSKETSDIQYSSVHKIRPLIGSHAEEKNASAATTCVQPLLENNCVPQENSIATKNRLMHSHNVSPKLNDIDHMSTVYEESEPSAVSASHTQTFSKTENDTNNKTIHEWLNTSLSLSSTNQKKISSSKERSSSLSNHRKKSIDATTKLTPIKSNTSIDYEFRVQTSNDSPQDGTNQAVFLELTNTKENSIRIPLINSMNNSKPFQKGQLDIFHLKIPRTFHTIKKINLLLSNANQDPLHIHYCELQDRQTMNTIHFPIEKWLGAKNTSNVEMVINNNNNNILSQFSL